MIDTHIHLDLKIFNKDLGQVIQNAKKAGVNKFIIPAIESNNMNNILEIVKEYKEVYFASGNHPNRMDSFNEFQIEGLLSHEKCVAVGECGLDWFRIPNGANIEEVKSQQKEYFRRQIELSIKYNKPLILHSRDTDDDMYNVLMEFKGKLAGGVIHCYVGSEKLLKLANEGFYFGLGGVLTFKNKRQLYQ